MQTCERTSVFIQIIMRSAIGIVSYNGRKPLSLFCCSNDKILILFITIDDFRSKRTVQLLDCSYFICDVSAALSGYLDKRFYLLILMYSFYMKNIISCMRVSNDLRKLKRLIW